MKLAAVRAHRRARAGRDPGGRRAAYGADGLRFGPEYLIPKPFDPRLIEIVAPAVAKAAMDSGVATRPIADFDAYRERLSAVRLPLGQRDEADVRRGASAAPKRVVYAEGEEERVLRAVQVVVDEGLGAADPDRPPDVIARAHRASSACA